MKVYAIINTVNGKMYIGKTSKSVSIRFTAHIKNIAKEFSCSYTTVWTRLKDVTGLTYNDWRKYYD